MKTLTLTILASCFYFGASAQTAATPEVTPTTSPDFHRVEFGFRFMPTVTAFKMKTSDGGTVQGQATLGFGIGGALGINFTNHIGVQAEIIYNSYSQKYKDLNMDRTMKVKYVNFPLLLSLNTGKSKPVNLNFVVGPQVGYNIGSSVQTAGASGTDTLTAVVVTKKADVGFAYGAGLEFALNELRTIRLDIGFRGVYGLLDIQPTTGIDSRSFNIIGSNNIKTYSGVIGISFLF